MFPGMSVKALDGRLHRLQHRLGIAPPGRPYDLRHTAITHAVAYAQVTPVSRSPMSPAGRDTDATRPPSILTATSSTAAPDSRT